MNLETNILPNAPDLEEIVLGAVMLEKTAIYQVGGLLAENDFYCAKRKKIYAAILKLYSKSLPIDLVTVAEELKKTKDLAFIGTPSYLAELTNRVGSAANIEFHCMILKQKSIRRQVIQTSLKLHEDGFDDSIDDLTLLDMAEASFTEISQHNAGNNYTDAGAVVLDIIKTQERLQANDGEIGLSCSSTVLGKVLQGWQPEKLIIVAARPGMGKSALVTNEAKHLSVNLGIPVALFSLEMSDKQLITRVVASEMDVNSRLIADIRQASAIDAQKIQTGLERVSSAPLYIDTKSQSIEQIKSNARILVREKDVKLIIIDYIQLITSTSNKGNREQEVSSISRALKLLSKELQIPVIALSQLSRAVETRGGTKRPQLSDLRESGSIEQDADIVIFIYRPEYYSITEDEKGESLKGVAEAIVAKNREGALMTVKLDFIPEFSKFKDWDDGTFLQKVEEVPALQETNGKAYNGMIVSSAKINNEEEVPF